MIRAVLLILVFLLGLAGAMLWYGQMHHLRRALPDALPAWTRLVAADAGLRQGRVDWPAPGLLQGLTLQWSARMPDLSGWRWDVRLSGAGIDVTGRARAPFWPGIAEVTVTGGRLDLDRVSPAAARVAGTLIIESGTIRVSDLGTAPAPEGQITGRVAGAVAAGTELGGGPLNAELTPDGAWTITASAEGGASDAGLNLRGRIQDQEVHYELVLDDDSALPAHLRDLLSANGRPEGDGWVLEGTLPAF